MAINEVAVVCPVWALRECLEDVVHLLVRLRRGLIVKLLRIFGRSGLVLGRTNRGAGTGAP